MVLVLTASRQRPKQHLHTTAGNDTLTGGDGADTFIITDSSATASTVTVTDLQGAMALQALDTNINYCGDATVNVVTGLDNDSFEGRCKVEPLHGCALVKPSLLMLTVTLVISTQLR